MFLWWMTPSMLLDCWGFLARELWVFCFIYKYIYINIWVCPVFPLGFWWAFWEETHSTASFFLTEGGCGEKWECRAGDLWPRGRLISAVTSPDVRLAVSPSQSIAHTHAFNTQLHTHPDTAQSPRPLLTVPQSCCMLSCSRQTAVFSALPFFSLSIDNAINHHIHTAAREGMCLSDAAFCVSLCVCFEDGFIDRRCGWMAVWMCCVKLQSDWPWTVLWNRVNRAAPVQVCVYHSAHRAERQTAVGMLPQLNPGWKNLPAYPRASSCRLTGHRGFDP